MRVRFVKQHERARYTLEKCALRGRIAGLSTKSSHKRINMKCEADAVRGHYLAEKEESQESDDRSVAPQECPDSKTIKENVA